MRAEALLWLVSIQLKEYKDHMKISLNQTAVLMVIAAMALSPSFAFDAQAATNLVSNGSFEAPHVTNPDHWDIFPSGTADLGWMVKWAPQTPTEYNGTTRPTVANLELQENGHLGFQSADGNQWAELDSDWFGPNPNPMSEGASVNIFQDISTIPGNQYNLSFSFSPRPDASSSYENVLNVSWNGSQIDSLSRQNNSGTQNEWQTYNYTLNATASTTRIMFGDGGIADSVGTYLDNVILSDMSGNGGGGNGGTGTSTGTSTSTTTDPGNGGGGTGTTTDPGNGGGGGTGTSTATTTPADGGGSTGGDVGGGNISGGGIGASGYGGSSGPSNGGGGQVLGASTGPSDSTSGGTSGPTGSVLGESTSSIPLMPYTGTNGNATLTYIVGYILILLASEAMISHFNKFKTQK